MNPQLNIFLIAAIMTVPFYFFNRFLLRKIKPRESGKNLLRYFVVMVVSVFIYITAAVCLVIAAAKLINKH
ncbi:MAG: hypothetical protein U0V75_14015 [Ferruginibacter sp.]